MENSGEDCVLSYVMEICNEDSSIGTTITSEEDPFQFSNDYAFELGFSIRKDRKRCMAGSGIIYMRQFNYHKEGKKFDKGKVEKNYSKVDIRINCKGVIEFPLNNDGGLIVSRNIAGHNHDFAVTKNHAGYLQELKDSGVSIAADLRVLKKQEQQEYGGFLLPLWVC
ncbi:hypothetical protein M9H77_22399 [Catharanthus roseus]|uniref:Uncharacterized protein n=1 Tax=Catharanthus roseus TaxID=4058 RepID=A0ACC0AUE1_CATRO|nr:hypothetical protein M9H77_22399 [Catharanthus roseus]